MNTTRITDQVKDAVESAETNLREASANAGRAVSEKSQQLAHSTSEGIRTYPVSSVVGAFVFGIAVGVLIATGRRQPTFYERYLNEPLDHAGDALSAISRQSRNLKFW